MDGRVNSSSFFMALTLNCYHCKKDFILPECWYKRGQGKYCSRICSNIDRKGKPSYIRTPEHKLRMSKIIKSNPCVLKASNNFKKLNHDKKGKTWEQIYGIEKATQNRKLFREKFTGESNPNYKEGQSFLPYAPTFTKLLKERIIIRDGFVCKGCRITHQELVDKDPFNRGLTIHHIDYNKNNSNESNLIALCRVCNSKANGDRDYHREYYTQLI